MNWCESCVRPLGRLRPLLRRAAGALGGVAAAALVVLWPIVLLAQEAQQAQNEFVPAESVPRQEVPSGPLLYGAYAFVWAAVLVYVFLLWRRIGRVERELAEVRRKAEAAGSKL